MSIYNDIETRTGGDIYIGVVGPVRTGKSTFIKKFMERLVLPNIADENDRRRALDEMPQSASGKTVTTTEPKFIPDKAVGITLDGGASLSVKMIDCVGYMVPDALGVMEDDKQRMVMTPWSADAMPFDRAAEIGTQKVISDHSTIGILVTSDGSFGELPRENYVAVEQRVAEELNSLGKPYVIVLNSSEPQSSRATALALELEEKYGAPVALVSCIDLDGDDIKNILSLVLLEFPVVNVRVSLPDFISALDESHPIVKSVRDAVLTSAAKVHKVGDISNSFGAAAENEYIKSVTVDSIDLGTGTAHVTTELNDGLFYDVIGEMTGFEIADDEALLELMRKLSQIKKKYDKVSAALDEVATSGYGIVMPEVRDMKLEEPKIVRQAGGYGVKLRACAPSIHMIKADIQTEVSPIVGTEQQSEELVKFMLSEFETNPQKIWDTNMFGKSLYDLVNEGLHAKLSHMPDDARTRLCETLSRVINEGSGGLVCIIL